jgi:hypothetical protein
MKGYFITGDDFELLQRAADLRLRRRRSQPEWTAPTKIEPEGLSRLNRLMVDDGPDTDRPPGTNRPAVRLRDRRG